MADRVHLTLNLDADGEEPVGSLQDPTGRSQQFWGWLELIETIQAGMRQLRQANAKKGTPRS